MLILLLKSKKVIFKVSYKTTQSRGRSCEYVMMCTCGCIMCNVQLLEEQHPCSHFISSKVWFKFFWPIYSHKSSPLKKYSMNIWKYKCRPARTNRKFCKIKFYALFVSDLISPNLSRIHERTISLRFLGIILRVLRIEVSVYTHYKPVSTHFCSKKGGGGG